ncbi:MAG TPA: type II secretion system protein GspL [Nitrospirota bacterium]|nr:type II secretion system protein GspL [Nitrospirota bacterium]
MRIVGLKIEKGLIAAAVIEKGMRQAELAGSFRKSFSTDAELVDILRENAKDWAGARIVSSVPGGRCSQRTVTLPFGDRKRIEKALPFELEDAVPFPLDDVQLDHITLDRQGADKKKQAVVAGLMVPKTVLRQHLDLLASAGVDPQVVVPSFAGLAEMARMTPSDGCALFLSDGDLCLKNGADIIACRSFSPAHPTRGVRHSVKSLETEHGVTIEKAYLFAGSPAEAQELVGLGVAVERLEPDFHGKKADDPVSLGLALSEQANFRKGEFAYRLADEGSRKRRNALITAGTFALVFFLANVGVKYYLVQSSYAALDREIRELYLQTFPGSKSAADPLRQLRSGVDEARKKFGALGSGTSALDVMKAVTDGVPPEVRVSFQDFLLEGDRLKLAGEVSSFESVDKLKAQLAQAPPFADIQVQDTRMGVDNKVKFRLDIKLKQAM